MPLPAEYGDKNRQELMLEGLKSGIIAFQDDRDNDSEVFRYNTLMGSLGNASPLGISKLLFLPFLKLQATDEQWEEWGSKAERGEIMGCYTQTELGHGTFVSRIETTATFDRSTDEFVIHSPTLTSTKYWPGALGYLATHSITIARLIIDDKDSGVHAFLMQIRSLEDGKPLPGIELGDIGLKIAYNGTDNGYGIFKHVRVPRTSLLMRHCTVTREGQYTAVPLRQKLVYGGMLNGRSIIVRTAGFQLAQALTIAIHYSTVRQQGRNPDGSGGELAIINYQHQKHRLLTLLSQAYAIIFAWQNAKKVYEEMAEQQKRGEHEMLPYVHILFCGLKAWSTQTAAVGAEEARKMCGGHGYMLLSGLPEIVAMATAMCTFEGEKFVMWAQVGRYLMKGMDSTTLPTDMAYISSLKDYVVSDTDIYFRNHDILLGIFQQRTAKLMIEAYELVKTTEKKGKTRAEALNLHDLPLLSAARAHIETYILSINISHLSSLPATTPKPITLVLHHLISLFALTTILSPFSLFSSTFLTYLTSPQISRLREEIDILLDEILPDAITLTDAFQFSDFGLNSALGCEDGNVYKGPRE